MKALIIYDSYFGNTEQIAQANGNAFSSKDDVTVLKVVNVKPEHLSKLNLLIVGSPTRKFRPTAAITTFLKRIPDNSLKDVRIAAFDTRIPEEDIEKIRILAFFVKIFGYAAKPILNRLVKKGGKLIAVPEGFYVGGTEGPLLENELERTAEWTKQIIKKNLI